jgi:hypothetical protein
VPRESVGELIAGAWSVDALCALDDYALISTIQITNPQR